MRIPAKWLAAIALAFAPAVLPGQAPPLGSEFLVNTYTTNFQDSPRVAAGGNGGFVVVWRSNYQNGFGRDVFGQRFDFLGQKVGSEFPVNAYTTGSQSSPSLAADGSGNFVVAWDGPQVSGYDIFGQRFSGAGATGLEFEANTTTATAQRFPSVAMRRQGDFVVVWGSNEQDGSGYGIFGQRFDAVGSKAGPEFSVSTFTTGSQTRPAVALDESGDFVVVWQSDGQDGSNSGVFGQRLNAAGSKAGAEFLVNTATAGFQSFPAVAMGKRGDFVVVWDSFDESSTGVFGQRFNGSAEKVGPEFLVNTYTTSDQEFSSVAMDPHGNFTVVWSSYSQDGSSFGVFGQRFDRAGGTVGTEFPLNTYTTSRQILPRVLDGGSGLVVVWEADTQDGSDTGIVGRRQSLQAGGLSVDVSGIGTSDLNGVLEPGEAVVIEPAWASLTSSTFANLQGVASTFTGPAGPTYALLDSSASYGTVSPGTLASCNDGAPQACYAVQLSGARPAVHWDVTLQETILGGTQFWTLHVGDSFVDVPRGQPFYKKIETVLHHGITSGCGGTQYCPGSAVPRDQMAIFIAKGIAGSGELVPTTGFLSGQAYNCSAGGVSRFSDVSPTDSFCRHVHYLAAQNVTLGCNPGQYCPGATVTRDAMASFIAKAIVAPEGGNAVPVTFSESGRSYSCNPASPNIHFSDVPVSNPFCKHVHFLWAKGVIAGCSATQYCPSQPVQRDAMAKFIANAFGLQLYEP